MNVNRTLIGTAALGISTVVGSTVVASSADMGSLAHKVSTYAWLGGGLLASGGAAFALRKASILKGTGGIVGVSAAWMGAQALTIAATKGMSDRQSFGNWSDVVKDQAPRDRAKLQAIADSSDFAPRDGKMQWREMAAADAALAFSKH